MSRNADTMRAAVLVAPGNLRVEERPVPRPGPNEVLVRVRYAGVCGTDLAIWRGEYRQPLPLILGHEYCGEIVACGPGAPAELVGTAVTSEISFSCLARRDPEPCGLCLEGLACHCARRRVLGIRGADGAFADRVVVPVGAVHRLPKGISPWAAVLAEPVASALQTFERSPIVPGALVVVLGTGRLGLLVCRIARSYGARVVAASRTKEKRELALRFGAHEALNPSDGAAVKAFRDDAKLGGADIVVDCTGRPRGLAKALEFVRPRGVVALKSITGRHAQDLDATDIVLREITLQGSRCGSIPKALERLASGQIPVDDFVSGVFPLEDIDSAFTAAQRATKVLLELEP